MSIHNFSAFIPISLLMCFENGELTLFPISVVNKNKQSVGLHSVRPGCAYCHLLYFVLENVELIISSLQATTRGQIRCFGSIMCVFHL